MGFFTERRYLFVTTAILAVAYLFNQNLNLAYPVFHLWDMDLMTVSDLVLIGEGLLPGHVHHP